MPTNLPPFFAELPRDSVVFDCPYFDIERAPRVQGVVGWGAHDPGVATRSRPAGLVQEIRERFGDFLAEENLYSFTWPSDSRTRAVARNFVEAVEQRTRIATWLLTERFPDWEVGLVVPAELHSATEPFWHGIDPAHPLHSLPGAEASGQGIIDVYEAVDRMAGKLITAFPDAVILAFAMHGMGPNESDVPSMVLLPELLYRWRYGSPALKPRPEWESSEPSMLGEDEYWENAIRQQIHPPESMLFGLRNMLRRAHRPRISAERREQSVSLDWIPATRYRRHWPDMQAFALPAYYHGRIRVNLEGREAHGKVPVQQYESVCAELTRILGECTNPQTGEAAVKHIDCFTDTAPLSMNETDADLDIIWNGSLTAMEHPLLGRIGPVPHRRTGGHTGDHGVAYLGGVGHKPGDLGQRSSFDVAPTVFDLLGIPVPDGVSGRSLLEGLNRNTEE
jgi:predicted AlkP superfamily phosphohydrolase/phosphomutase